MALDPDQYAHQQWLGYLQPVGLLVSPPALVTCQAILPGNVAAEQAAFLAHIDEVRYRDLKALFTDPDLFDWRGSDFAEPPVELEVVLTAYGETLRPTYAVPEPNGGWQLLVMELSAATPFDEAMKGDDRHWQTTPQVRFERLLRESGVPIGLLANGTHLRLVHQPRGESPGHVTFPIAQLATVAGRPALAALLLLLGAPSLFTLPDNRRLPHILSESRKYQSNVSTELAEQVLAALFELLRGFQAADDQSNGDLLRGVLAHDPDQVYAGLVTVLMRLVFLLYAEDRGLMSSEEIYVQNYSVTGLFERLREDFGHNPDTMDQRYGGWAQLLALFRMVHRGGGHGGFRLPARHGYLFEPERYSFLEGISRPDNEEEAKSLPLVPDGTIYRALSNLLILKGERISYRTLDVEQIGSVYEAIMGYRLERATGRSIALKPKKAGGAPVTIDLDALLACKPAERAKWMKEHADQAVDGKPLAALKEAKTPEDAVAALQKRIALALTPNIVPQGGMILQPSDERRRSGSHYTPRALTGPIVRKALEPILMAMGPQPTPQAILSLKICDPAMGSGAFLVEACRQLSDELVKAWHATGTLPRIPPDEDELLHAGRLIAQRCLYGVDRNPMAVQLGKLSLWLATLAKDHPFTFLDHSLREGDSLVGLTTEQIRGFRWTHDSKQMITGQERLVQRIAIATRLRAELLALDDETPQLLKEQKLANADEALNLVRFAGNLVVAAFFAADKDKARNQKRDEYAAQFGEFLAIGDMKLYPAKEEAALRAGPHPVMPFHWEIEYPEVFSRDSRGFDVIVGNPPFAGKNTIADGNRAGYPDWLKALHEESHGNADLVAHFFRRAFDLLRVGGTFGLIATNTIAQGDTRSSGLRWIRQHGGTIYSAQRRYKWPGLAAVVVSVVHIFREQKGRGGQGEKGSKSQAIASASSLPISHSPLLPLYTLDGKQVKKITAYLFHQGGDDDPAPLAANAGKSFVGSYVLGMGFTFDDTDKNGVASPLSLMNELIAKDSRNAERIFPYIGGEEVNDSPTHQHHRYVINFGDMPLEEARKWPDLLKIVEDKVKGTRGSHSTAEWWQFERSRAELYNATSKLKRALVIAQTSKALAFTFKDPGTIYSHTVIVFPFDDYSTFAILQSRIHFVFAVNFAATMKDDLRYLPSDCFETFPFPENFEGGARLETVGRAYYEYRAALMVKNDEGLTKTYNRFHDPSERSAEIAELRRLHAAMDHAVLDAYGGALGALTLPPCEFLLDYEDEEEGEPGASAPGGRQRKKPWRYRWPDAFRDEVLALLLELNKQRAEAERLKGPAAKKSVGRKKKAAEGDMFKES